MQRHCGEGQLCAKNKGWFAVAYAVTVSVAARDDIGLVEEPVAYFAGHERAEAVEVGPEDFEQLQGQVS